LIAAMAGMSRSRFTCAGSVPPAARVGLIRWAVMLTAGLSLWPGPPCQAQTERFYTTHVSPFPYAPRPEPPQYNLKLGRLLARFHGAVGFEFVDNVGLTDTDPEADLIVAPRLGVDFFWPLSQWNTLEFSLDAAYRAYVDHSDLNSLFIAPGSRLDYRLFVHDVEISIHDVFSIQADPTSRGQISGVTNDLIEFRRLFNVAGLEAEWRPVRDTTFRGGYDYVLDRSLSDDFASIDRDEHVFHAAFEHAPSPRWTVGVHGQYRVTEYRLNIQNDGTGYTIGPVALWRPGEFVTLELAVGYTAIDYDPTGTVADTSDFDGVTVRAAVHHTLNRRLRHSLRFSRTPDLGFGSNFTDLWSLEYRHHARLSSRVDLFASLAYENLQDSSSTGETADRYLVHVGTDWRLARDWLIQLGYGLAVKDSGLAGRDYLQNRVVLELIRKF
jgi:hypothetical protein